MGHFQLARAYLEAGLFVEADSELDRCIKRRGEALSLFLDQVPTFGYFPTVYYYQGRAREGLKSSGFADAELEQPPAARADCRSKPAVARAFDDRAGQAGHEFALQGGPRPPRFQMYFVAVPEAHRGLPQR